MSEAPPSERAADAALPVGRLLRLAGVQTGRAEARRINGRSVLTAIGKQAVAERVAVRRLGLAGDEQADLSVHGGLSKAVYAYPALHYRFWQTVRAQAQVSLWDDALPFGALGENLTVTGGEESDWYIGDRWVLPDCVLAVSEPRTPCFKFNAAMGFAQAGKLMMQSGFCGAYLAVIEEGTLGVGDSVRIDPGPREVSIREVLRSRAARTARD